MNDSSTARPRSVFPGLAFIIGMVAFALIVRQTVLSAKRLDEYVTVKGLSEREVPADLAIWPISLSVMEDELASLQGQIAKARATVRDFLLGQGFEFGEISQSPPQ